MGEIRENSSLGIHAPNVSNSIIPTYQGSNKVKELEQKLEASFTELQEEKTKNVALQTSLKLMTASSSVKSENHNALRPEVEEVLEEV